MTSGGRWTCLISHSVSWLRHCHPQRDLPTFHPSGPWGHPQGWLFLPLLLLVTSIPAEASLEIDYIPVLTRKPLEGSITSSTFTLDQPSGQFNSPILSDTDDIWLVVAFSNAINNFTAPQSPQGIPHTSTFLEKKYYMTIRASRALYSNETNAQDIRILRVGNDTKCTGNTCNAPLPGPGPYRVKFLVMNDNGPVAETKWSEDITLIKPEEVSEIRAPKSTGTIVIIVILSILLSLLFLALVALLVYTCFDICGTKEISRPEESVQVRRYNTHHSYSVPDAGRS
ncbi:uroplakin-3b-like protein 1 [Phascolarctos cinereus]|uniref:Uroplakin-3b-like protein n=1 Tax=Phascolarctos cinereus TaxID=38626 RepID=A0A6P5LZS9_PHACI|nr:uroplakin-3b-like protein [Phascolarctos cinereus]XP_020861511.1 uroplakin-3b-like protein [Phascolarctos cinereus]XP_020861512.1 uroplakin-3b-like protein [Phascolarctos cinereus]